MRIDGVKVEFSSDQEDDRLDGFDARETARFTLGGLKQTVDGLKKTVGLSGLRPGDNALQMRANHLGHLLHRIDLGAHHTGAPMLKRDAHHVDLFAIKNFAQLFLVDPRRSAPSSHSGAVN